MTQRNTDTLRDAMFANIEGLKTGAITPEVAKASASCAMAICKTVDLDIKATELLKKTTIEPLQLTTEPEPLVISCTPELVELLDEETREKIDKGDANGLTAGCIASRLGIGIDLVIQHLGHVDSKS